MKAPIPDAQVRAESQMPKGPFGQIVHPDYSPPHWHYAERLWAWCMDNKELVKEVPWCREWARKEYVRRREIESKKGAASVLDGDGSGASGAGDVGQDFGGGSL